MLVGY